MPKNTVEETSSSIERNRSAGSTLRIRDPSNSYKCYDSIPTPSPISPQSSAHNSLETTHLRSQSQNSCASTTTATAKNRNHECKSAASQNSLQRAASLDSLVNSSEQETSEEDDVERLSDSDSLLELTQIKNETSHHHLRQSDLAQLRNDDPQNEIVIKAYLEKSHKKCDYKNCGFKRPDSYNSNFNQEDPIMPSPLKFLGPHTHPASNNGTVSLVSSNKSNRRNSIASASSVPKMETILEEPIEAKVSVKEILARFETLREAAEVNLITFYLHINCANNYSLSRNKTHKLIQK